MIEGVEHSASGPDREVECQAEMERLMRQIITEANMHGWGSIEALNAMEVVLKKFHLTYAEDPGPGSAPLVSELEPSSDANNGAP